MGKVYTRLRINETYRAANTDDLADLGGFSIALRKGQVSYAVTIRLDGRLIKTEKHVFNAKGESIDHWHEVQARSFQEAESRMSAFWEVFIDQHRVWFGNAKQLFDHSIQSGRSPRQGGGAALWSTAHIAMSRAHSLLSKPGQVNQQEVVISRDSEVLIIVGTEQHSSSYGNKLMFPAQAVREVRQNYKDHKHITIIMFQDGFTAMQLSIVKHDAKSHNRAVYFKFINSTAELIQYINRGDATISRDVLKIGTIKIFSHGLPSILDFGLDGVNNSSQRFGVQHVSQLQLDAFIKKPVIESFACRTGNSSSGEFFLSNWQDEIQMKRSLAQKLSDYLDAKVIAYLRRSNYETTWVEGHDAAYNKKYMTITDESTDGVVKAIKDILRGSRNTFDEALWNSDGAYNLPRAGSTPKGLPADMYVFEKGKDPISK